MGFLGLRRKVREGSKVELRQSSVAMCSGTVIKVYDKDLVEVEIDWTLTSVFEKGYSYKIDLGFGVWKAV